MAAQSGVRILAPCTYCKAASAATAVLAAAALAEASAVAAASTSPAASAAPAAEAAKNIKGQRPQKKLRMRGGQMLCS